MKQTLNVFNITATIKLHVTTVRPTDINVKVLSDGGPLNDFKYSE